jgi:signal transduction histidine kinase
MLLRLNQLPIDLALDNVKMDHRKMNGEDEPDVGLLIMEPNPLKMELIGNDLYAAIVRSMGVPVITTDHNYRILTANRAAEKLLNQSESGLAGHLLFDLFLIAANRDDMPPPAWNIEPGQGSETTGITIRGRFPLRERPQVVVSVMSNLVELEGEKTGYVHLLQEALMQEQLALARDDFLLDAAHELRAPLSSLRASIELLGEDYSTMSKSELSMMLRAMRKAVVKFQTLVDNLIEIGSIKAGQFRVRPVAVSLDEIIHDAVSQIERLLHSHGQVLEVKQEGAKNLTVMADRHRIMRVIINLITNASKYGLEDSPIVLTTCRGGGFAFVGVTDFGPGISPEEQNRIFERFYRSKATEKEGSGIGLGLGLARNIVEAHGGTIHLTSAPGMGTTFWFSLPESVGQRVELGRQS